MVPMKLSMPIPVKGAGRLSTEQAPLLKGQSLRVVNRGTLARVV
jgi:hypothetical protein